jgi:sulfide:quinone oxidoreductase
VLGAGFGGLELASILSQRLGDRLDLTLIDKSPSFYFGYSKLDVMFGRKSPGSVKYPYSRIRKPGVRFRQEEIRSIDPHKKQVITNAGNYEADVLVIALGADYDLGATPGLEEGGYEFYSFEGAERVRKILPSFSGGHVLVGVTSFPFKCPPAPSETALLLHEYLVRQGVRQKCSISLVVPFELPIPPSYGTSKALLASFQEKNITYIPEIMVGALDPARRVAVLDDGSELAFDLFLGIPEHKVPKVVEESGLLFDEWIQVDKRNMKTTFPYVYAIGDVSSAGTPKSGLFAASAARTAAESILSEFLGLEYTGHPHGEGSCYIEFGEGKVARVDVDFFSGPVPTGKHQAASKAFSNEKNRLELQSKSFWFGEAVSKW